MQILDRNSRIGLTKIQAGGPQVQLVADGASGKTLEALDPEIRESVSILESEISKTIENNMSKIKENEEEIEKMLENTRRKKPTGIFTDNFNVEEAEDDFITPIVETIPEDEKIEIIKKPLPTPPALPPSTHRHSTTQPVTMSGKKGIEDDYVIEDVSHMRKPDGMKPMYGKDFDTTLIHLAATTSTSSIASTDTSIGKVNRGEHLWRPVTKSSGFEVKTEINTQIADRATEVVTTKSTFRDSQTTLSTPLASTESTQQEQISTTTSLASQTPTQSSPNAFTATAISSATVKVRKGNIHKPHRQRPTVGEGFRGNRVKPKGDQQPRPEDTHRRHTKLIPTIGNSHSWCA